MLGDYYRLMAVNGSAQVYQQALRVGLLDAMSGGPRPVGELAARCGLRPGPVELMLAVLEALGVVDRHAADWRLTELGQALMGGGYRRLGDEYWEHLSAFLRSGEPMARMDQAQQSPAHYQKQAAALAWMLASAAEQAARMLEFPRGAGGWHILDLGAGSAIWSLSLARRVAGTRVTAVDWPAVLEVAKATAARLGLAERLTTIAGDMHAAVLPAEAFDLAVIANVIHLLSHEQTGDLLRRVRGLLKPGGRVVVIDVFAGRPEGDLHRTLYALGLALRTTQGSVYERQEVERLLAASGYERADFKPLEVPPFVMGMIVGSCPPRV